MDGLRRLGAVRGEIMKPSRRGTFLRTTSKISVGNLEIHYFFYVATVTAAKLDLGESGREKLSGLLYVHSRCNLVEREEDGKRGIESLESSAAFFSA